MNFAQVTDPIDPIIVAVVNAVVTTVHDHPYLTTIIVLAYIFARVKEIRTEMPKQYHPKRKKVWFVLLNLMALNVGRLIAFSRISRGLPPL